MKFKWQTLVALFLLSFPVYADTFTISYSGSDSRSKEFNDNFLPVLSNLVQKDLNILPQDCVQIEKVPILRYDENIRVYFIGEDTGYHNSFGINETLIFNDASQPPNNNMGRTKRFPLLPGDFVDLGKMRSGDELDFYLIANNKRMFRSSDEDSRSKIFVNFAQANNPYIIVSFEDSISDNGRRDYSDNLLAIYIGENNVQDLLNNNYGVPAPEPEHLWIVIIILGIFLMFQKVY